MAVIGTFSAGNLQYRKAVGSARRRDRLGSGASSPGASDFLTDGMESFMVMPRDVAPLTDGLRRLADDTVFRDAMFAAALERARGVGGWSAYGDRMTILLDKLFATGTRS
jgi:hypothetical protein